MLDRSHPTNKHDVEIARIRRSTRIAVYSIGSFLIIVGYVFSYLHPSG